MTSYLSPDSVYQRTLLKLVEEAPSEAECLMRIRTIREDAKRKLEESQAPGFTPPYVSYMPAYGAKESIEAISDFNQLRSILSVDCHFRNLLLRCLDQELDD